MIATVTLSTTPLRLLGTLPKEHGFRSWKTKRKSSETCALSVQRYGQIEIEWGIKEVSLLDRREMAIDVCKRYMVDFREIFRADWHETGMPGLLPRELITRPVTSRAFIEAQLAKPFHGTTVVLTHHAPSPRSLDPKFHAQETNAAFASDLTPTIQNGKPDLWVHGHIHRFVDYYEGCTRIVCNPRGYPYEREKNGFQVGFVVNI